jgi:gliding motility-associated-like protein
MKHLWCICVCYSFFSTVIAQNLISNPSFEEHSRCPNELSTLQTDRLAYSIPWFSMGGTPDFYHVCGSDDAAIPPPLSGEQQARTGEGMAGLRVYHVFKDNKTIGRREYVAAPLTAPLKAGKAYYFEFFVNHQEKTMTSDAIGMAVCKTLPTRSDDNYVLENIQPQIEQTTNLFLTDDEGWTKISGCFNAEGGEKYIILGNFKNDETTNHKGLAFDSYYFIDDVKLVPAFVDLGADLSFCEDEEINIELNAACDVPKANWLWQETTQEPKYQAVEVGRYWVQLQNSCGNFSDTILLYRTDCDVNTYVPNAFSPNGDQHNDYFFPFVASRLEMTDFYFAVFQRWGNLIFETRDCQTQGWDGTFKGTGCDSDAYIWVMECTVRRNGILTKIQKSGNVSLIR